MRRIFKILVVCSLIVSYAQTVYAMNSESIAQILNSTFNVEFTSKKIDSLSKQDRTNLENIAEKAVMGQLLVASGVSGLESKRQHALQNITKVVEALVPDDPLKAGLQKAISTAAGPVAGKADMAIKVGSIITLLPSLIKNINEKYELPFINIYLQERNNGKTHDEAWKIATTGDNKVLIEAGIPAGLNLEKTKEKSKELFESSTLATAQSSEWNQARKNEVLPRFESAKKNEEQKSTFWGNVKNTAKDLLKQIKEDLIPTAKAEQIKIIKMPEKLPMNLPQGRISDSSKLRETTGQEKLTPVRIEFTQTYDGLFTQSADAPGSRYGSHSGTLTDGTRVNVIGDSRSGDFTGSFSGRTVAEPGYTPATHNNSAFSGSSVGKVSAIGFKEGDLKGTMTVTVPAGTQTVNVTGNITIKTDGSLSMPSYSGPVTDNTTGAKVGTMSGSWSQSKTR